MPIFGSRFTVKVFKSTTGIHLIVDLDSTMLSTKKSKYFNKVDPFNNPKFAKIRDRFYAFNIRDNSTPGYGDHTLIWGLFRPGFRKFINDAFSTFKTVSVWSAGSYKYVHALCKLLFPDSSKQPFIIFTRDDMIYYPVKDLNQFYDKAAEKGVDMNSTNTVILDDNKVTFVRNMNNVLHIIPYEPKENNILADENDRELEKVIEWATQSVVRNASDIRTVSKGSFEPRMIDD